RRPRLARDAPRRARGGGETARWRAARPALRGRGGRVPPDDVMDAAAAAWSAHRIALGTAVSLPDPPETTRDGLPVAIWY
ncbi:DUF429 domain-containing protein, partial [Streptomyces sp. NPDC059590]|uniref:DUF429 domain-containing protein n=1 Tax=Streptomyces sp. NPDC059590 TaxID=3346877 RepID=UPI0036CA3B2F